MKLTVACFQSQYGHVNTQVIDDGSPTCWADKHADYVRVSQNVEVEFPDLAREEIIAKRVQSLDAQADKITDDFHRAIAHITDQKEKLLALPNHVSPVGA